MLKVVGNIFILAAIILVVFLGYEQYQAHLTKEKLMESMEVFNVPVEATVAEAAVTSENGVTLHIPRIDLSVPVFEGTTKDILAVAIGHLSESGSLGAIDENFVLLGHRSHTTGKFFNRLDEMQIDDEFTVTANGNEYHYRVIEKKIIEPTQLEVIEPREGQSLVTLITCHPLYSNKQRLVVTATQAQS